MTFSTTIMCSFLERKSKQRWSTIPPISTNRTIISHFKQLNTKKGQRHMILKIQMFTSDRHINVAELNLLFL